MEDLDWDADNPDVGISHQIVLLEDLLKPSGPDVHGSTGNAILECKGGETFNEAIFEPPDPDPGPGPDAEDANPDAPPDPDLTLEVPLDPGPILQISESQKNCPSSVYPHDFRAISLDQSTHPGISGQNVKVTAKIDQNVVTHGLDKNQVTDTPFGYVASHMTTNKGPVTLVTHQCARVIKGHSTSSLDQWEWYKHSFDDNLVHLDNLQGVGMADGSLIPLLFSNHGPPGPSIYPSFDWEFDFLPDKVLMANGEWDSLPLESFEEDTEEWFDALHDHGECYFFEAVTAPHAPNAKPVTITAKDEDDSMFVDSLEDSDHSRGAFYEQVPGRTIFSAVGHVLGFLCPLEVPACWYLPWQLHSNCHYDRQIVLVSPMLSITTTSDSLNPLFCWLLFISSIFKSMGKFYAKKFLKPLF